MNTQAITISMDKGVGEKMLKNRFIRIGYVNCTVKELKWQDAGTDTPIGTPPRSAKESRLNWCVFDVKARIIEQQLVTEIKDSAFCVE